jgi:hypothetical protein
MVAMNREANVTATREAGARRRAESRRAVLEACRRLKGVRPLTASALSEETGFGLDTCRTCRGELLKAGLIEMDWRDLSARGRREELGLTAKDRPVIRKRIAKVAAVKRLFGDEPIPLSILVQILPA